MRWGSTAVPSPGLDDSSIKSLRPALCRQTCCVQTDMLCACAFSEHMSNHSLNKTHVNTHTPAAVGLNTWSRVQSVRLRKSLQRTACAQIFPAYIPNPRTLLAASPTLLISPSFLFLFHASPFHHVPFVPLILSFFVTSPLLWPSSSVPFSSYHPSFLLFLSCSLPLSFQPLSFLQLQPLTSLFTPLFPLQLPHHHPTGHLPPLQSPTSLVSSLSSPCFHSFCSVVSFCIK